MVRLLDIGVVVLLAGSILFTFGDPLLAMVHQWDASPMYSYGYAVPVISLYLLWSRREAFRQRPLKPAKLRAIPVIALALVMQVLGHVGAIQVLQQVAFLVAIVGVVLFLFGTHYLAVSAPAIAYLLFMVPLWDGLTDPLHWPFQNQSARMGVALMHAAGVPALREGTFITLPNVLIEVARECSGVNYLVAVLALALPMAVLRLDTLWRRALLMCGALVIAASANGFRVALIGALAYHEVGTPLHGPFHILNGLFVSAVGFIALFLGLHILQTPPAPNAAANKTNDPPRHMPSGRWRVRDACGLALLFWTLVFVGLAPDASPVALAQPLDAVSQTLGAWSVDPFGQAIADPVPSLSAWKDADDHLRRHYNRADGHRATIDIWYFKTQSQRREIVGTRVADLHRLSLRKVIALASGKTLDVNLIRWPESQQVGLFWYDLGGITESDPYATILRSLWNVISIGRSNGAVMMLRSSLSDASDTQVVGALEDLASELQPAFADVRAFPRTP